MRMNLIRMNIASFPRYAFGVFVAIGFATLCLAAEKPPQVSGVDGVKTYLLSNLTKMDKAAADFVVDAAAYAKIIDANGGDYAKALVASREEFRTLAGGVGGV
jgi:hypothetical protein